ncbi:ChbG/HpnK family deacetylase [Georgenia alba]|uniref:ChbG/HpnK family deacetylase n=1 Tax=Georgenia alba TaxID=2233858 RepID=A0ABW2Q9V6_9MICO
MTRRLVLTADDLGRDPATNDTVLALLAEHAVSATTLVPVSPDAADAARRARVLRARPRLHVTLTGEQGRPAWAPLTAGASLTGPRGALLEDPHELAAGLERDDLVAELDAQLGWMRTQGFVPAAVDSHAGTLYGLHGAQSHWVADEALAWCARHGLALRLPRDLAPYAGTPVPDALAGHHARAVALADGLGVPIPAAILTNRRTAADLGSYEALRADLVARLETLPDGISELFLHPVDEADRAGRDPVHAWEARLLRDPAWHGALSHHGIEVVAGWWV